MKNDATKITERATKKTGFEKRMLSPNIGAN